MEVSPFSKGQRSFLEGAGGKSECGRIFDSRAPVSAGGEAAVAWGGGRGRTKQGENHPASISEWAPSQGRGFSDGPASAAAPAQDKQLCLAHYSLFLFTGDWFYYIISSYCMYSSTSTSMSSSSHFPYLIVFDAINCHLASPNSRIIQVRRHLSKSSSSASALLSTYCCRTLFFSVHS